ncbi:MAG: aconitase X catalytic domain-containing protein [Conexivisphaerales archaeon]
MHLTNYEEAALKGEYGEAIASSYRVLVALGDYMGADRLIAISSAHISGVNYANIGDEGLVFLEKFASDAKVRVKTTLNPCGMQVDRPEVLKTPADFATKQKRIIEIYAKLGVRTALSCVPYEYDNKPRKGSHAAWAESSASIYGNSILGIMTNRESAISSLAAAITGKVPNAGMHVKENRVAGIAVSVDVELDSTTDFGMLGLYAGKLTSKPIGFTGIKKMDRFSGKALGAGIGTSGSSPMFIILKDSNGLETIHFGKKELNEIKESLSNVEDPQMILLGCPFYALQEVSRLASGLRGRRVTKPTYLHLSSSVYSRAERVGLIDRLRSSGVNVVKDACPSLTPIGSWNGYTDVVTDSPKGSYYMRTALKYNVNVWDIDSIIRSYSK